METPVDEEPKINTKKGKIKPQNHHHHSNCISNSKSTLNFVLLPCLWFLFIFYWLSHNKTINLIQSNQKSNPRKLVITTVTPVINNNHTTTIVSPADNHTPAPLSTCSKNILPFYIYNLPSKFNNDFFKNCKNLNIYTDMCPYLSHQGLGQSLPNMIPSSSSPSNWYSTHQFIAEVIFHARLQNHPCRVHNPNQAQLFYVPFYGGLYASSSFRLKDHAIRDRLAADLAEFLVKQQPWWGKHNGKDHFMVIGRTAWDFVRNPDIKPSEDFGGNSLFNLEAIRNMSAVVTVEKQPWAKDSNQVAIPYPSYFHPMSIDELVEWKHYVRGYKRQFLYSFVGGARNGVDEKSIIRTKVMDQCYNSSKCKMLDCSSTPGKSKSAIVGKCYVPREVFNIMLGSKFCLQAPGDSYTRRSTFDSILTGCIPVFFSKHTAYSQYQWHLPGDFEEYSVFIDLNREVTKSVDSQSIEDVLARIPESRVEEMRERVLSLLSNVTYMHPNSSDFRVHDVVDITMGKISDRVRANLSFLSQ